MTTHTHTHTHKTINDIIDSNLCRFGKRFRGRSRIIFLAAAYIEHRQSDTNETVKVCSFSCSFSSQTSVFLLRLQPTLNQFFSTEFADDFAYESNQSQTETTLLLTKSMPDV
jgi:hypothetical protein